GRHRDRDRAERAGARVRALLPRRQGALARRARHRTRPLDREAPRRCARGGGGIEELARARQHLPRLPAAAAGRGPLTPAPPDGRESTMSKHLERDLDRLKKELLVMGGMVEEAT